MKNVKIIKIVFWGKGLLKMIEFANEFDREQIKKLWKDTFGDSDESVDKFLNEYIACVLLYKEGKKLLGMLSMLPVKAEEKKGRYIYAVATDRLVRGRGISTALLEFVNKYIKENGEFFSVLVPAEESLFDFYKKRGYSTISCIKKEEFQGRNSFLDIKKMSAERLFYLRKEFFGKNFISWQKKELSYIADVYDNNIFEISSGEKSAFAVCSFNEGKLEIKELCSGGLLEKDCAIALNNYFKTDTCVAKIPSSDGEAYAMVYPMEYKNFTFNLAID